MTKNPKRIIVIVMIVSIVILPVAFHLAIVKLLHKNVYLTLMFTVPIILLLIPRFVVELKAQSKYGKSITDIEFEQKDPATGSDMVVFRNYLAQISYVMIILLASYFGAMALFQKSIVGAAISYFLAIGGSYVMYKFLDKMKPSSKK